jgi:ABC-2 type transport system permease protein
MPAHAVLGDVRALIVLLALGFAALAAAILIVAPRFGAYAVAAASADAAPSARARRPSALRAASPRRALRRKEWILLRRDPWLLSQTLMQMLYLLPPALLLWRSFAAQSPGGALNLLVPVLVMAAGQLAGGLAWLTISGEDAPDLVATAPIPPSFVLRAKIEAVLGVIAAVFTPLIAVLAFASPWHALLTLAGIIAASAAATAIQLWFRTQAKRSQFRRRQVSSRVATFAEAFSCISFAATAGIAAVSLPLAIVPGIIALAVVAGARYLSPRKS